MADYLEAYAARFELPVLTGVTVTRLSRVGEHFVVEAGERKFEAAQVVVAMADYQRGHVPEFARQLDPRIVQLHSADYKNPAQLREGGVLLVGAGNSGAEIAMELAPRAPRLDVGTAPRARAVQVRRLAGEADLGSPGLPSGVPPHPDREDADGAQGARQGPTWASR